MAGYLLLEGGAEFGGCMADADRRAMTLAGGSDAPIVILPTAAAPDNNDVRAGGNGERWFKSLGATNVVVLGVVDQRSANDAAMAAEIEKSRLVYLLGGFTHYLGQTLVGSKCQAAMERAYRAGAVISGSSAGAMVMCEQYYVPSEGQVYPGLGFVPGACVLPHHDTFGHRWASRVRALLPNDTLLGIDEGTGIIDDGPDRRWSVYGQGTLCVYGGDQRRIVRAGDTALLYEGDLPSPES